MTTEYFLEQWAEARSRFTQQVELMTEDDLRRRLAPAPNSAGFLVRHIGDVELLFARNVFGQASVRVTAKTVIAGRDTGEWTDLVVLKEYIRSSAEALSEAIRSQGEDDWSVIIETKEFGKRTKAQALGRIVSHTAYHAGQLALIRKYGALS